ncbi:MAG TPA: glycosyltransferase family 2 protein [Bryobacteraceae bacterium]|nr:glycosyltransferase family 2 protein [Bryobacteraceae bacterium]
MEDVGIIVVTYNSGAEIGPCLEAAVATGAEIVVVDNASEDRTRQEVERRGVRLIANPRNLGFAAAVNQGVRALSAPLLLLLNPDAMIQTSIEPMRQACLDSQTAAAGGMLIDERGEPQAGFMVRRFPTPAALCLEALGVNRVWPRNPVNWHYRCFDLDCRSAVEVEQPAGAFLMIRRDVWEKLSGFDESFYPLWFEDVDFLKRAADSHYRIRFVPDSVAKHTGGHSIQKISLEFRQLYWYGNLFKYAAKHFSPGGHKLVCLAVIFGSMLRSMLGFARHRSLKPIAVYGNVVRLASRELFLGSAG